jgi:DNA-binding transcriptional ArsR family regulator
MPQTNWNRQFFAGTRGRIITLLRRSSRTVDELAQALGLTHTAVRAHLAALERDGMVQQRSERRGSRKPSSVYDLAPAAEYLFPNHMVSSSTSSWKSSRGGWRLRRSKRSYVRSGSAWLPSGRFHLEIGACDLRQLSRFSMNWAV